MMEEDTEDDGEVLEMRAVRKSYTHAMMSRSDEQPGGVGGRRADSRSAHVAKMMESRGDDDDGEEEEEEQRGVNDGGGGGGDDEQEDDEEVVIDRVPELMGRALWANGGGNARENNGGGGGTSRAGRGVVVMPSVDNENDEDSDLDSACATVTSFSFARRSDRLSQSQQSAPLMKTTNTNTANHARTSTATTATAPASTATPRDRMRSSAQNVYATSPHKQQQQQQRRSTSAADAAAAATTATAARRGGVGGVHALLDQLEKEFDEVRETLAVDEQQHGADGGAAAAQRESVSSAALEHAVTLCKASEWKRQLALENHRVQQMKFRLAWLKAQQDALMSLIDHGEHLAHKIAAIISAKLAAQRAHATALFHLRDAAARDYARRRKLTTAAKTTQLEHERAVFASQVVEFASSPLVAHRTAIHDGVVKLPDLDSFPTMTPTPNPPPAAVSSSAAAATAARPPRQQQPLAHSSESASSAKAAGITLQKPPSPLPPPSASASSNSARHAHAQHQQQPAAAASAWTSLFSTGARGKWGARKPSSSSAAATTGAAAGSKQNGYDESGGGASGSVAVANGRSSGRLYDRCGDDADDMDDRSNSNSVKNMFRERGGDTAHERAAILERLASSTNVFGAEDELVAVELEHAAHAPPPATGFGFDFRAGSIMSSLAPGETPADSSSMIAGGGGGGGGEHVVRDVYTHRSYVSSENALVDELFFREMRLAVSIERWCAKIESDVLEASLVPLLEQCGNVRTDSSATANSILESLEHSETIVTGKWARVVPRYKVASAQVDAVTRQLNTERGFSSASRILPSSSSDAAVVGSTRGNSPRGSEHRAHQQLGAAAAAAAMSPRGSVRSAMGGADELSEFGGDVDDAEAAFLASRRTSTSSRYSVAVAADALFSATANASCVSHARASNRSSAPTGSAMLFSSSAGAAKPATTPRSKTTRASPATTTTTAAESSTPVAQGHRDDVADLWLLDMRYRSAVHMQTKLTRRAFAMWERTVAGPIRAWEARRRTLMYEAIEEVKRMDERLAVESNLSYMPLHECLVEAQRESERLFSHVESSTWQRFEAAVDGASSDDGAWLDMAAAAATTAAMPRSGSGRARGNPHTHEHLLGFRASKDGVMRGGRSARKKSERTNAAKGGDDDEDDDGDDGELHGIVSGVLLDEEENENGVRAGGKMDEEDEEEEDDDDQDSEEAAVQREMPSRENSVMRKQVAQPLRALLTSDNVVVCLYANGALQTRCATDSAVCGGADHADGAASTPFASLLVLRAGVLERRVIHAAASSSTAAASSSVYPTAPHSSTAPTASAPSAAASDSVSGGGGGRGRASSSSGEWRPMLATVTLDRALHLFELPEDLGRRVRRYSTAVERARNRAAADAAAANVESEFLELKLDDTSPEKDAQNPRSSTHNNHSDDSGGGGKSGVAEEERDDDDASNDSETCGAPDSATWSEPPTLSSINELDPVGGGAHSGAQPAAAASALRNASAPGDSVGGDGNENAKARKQRSESVEQQQHHRGLLSIDAALRQWMGQSASLREMKLELPSSLNTPFASVNLNSSTISTRGRIVTVTEVYRKRGFTGLFRKEASRSITLRAASEPDAASWARVMSGPQNAAFFLHDYPILLSTLRHQRYLPQPHHRQQSSSKSMAPSMSSHTIID